MATETRPTPARLRVLRAIEAGEIDRYWPLMSSASEWRAPDGIRADVITRCVDAGWARVGPRSSMTRSPAELTDAGRAVLAANPEGENA